MTRMTVSALCSVPLGELLPEHAGESHGNLRVGGIQSDSRLIRSGELFLALPGARFHGLDFLSEVLAAGAIGIAFDTRDRHRLASLSVPIPLIEVDRLAERVLGLAERFYGNAIAGLSLIGITGTNGKTSCARLLVSALESLGMPAGYIGTLGWGRGKRLHPLLHTTPDLLCTYRSLADLASLGARTVAMEVSSHALAMGRCAGLQFDVALFTNLSRDHLDFHGSMESYAESKRSLFATPGLGAAVINGDDAFGAKLLRELDPKTASLDYGLASERQLWATDLEYAMDGLRAHVRTPWGKGVLRSRLLGRFNVLNLLGVIGVLGVSGVSLAEQLNVMISLQPIPGRLELVNAPNKPTVVIDYAHTPDALGAALQALRVHCHGRLVCVFGAGGDRDRGKRPLMGQIASRLADTLVVTSDNPRTEDPERIIDDILCGADTARCDRIPDRSTAIAGAIRRALPADWILLAGKGHELYQEIGGKTLPFSDRELAEKALAQWELPA